MNNKKILQSSISLDLGAANTGIFLFNHLEGTAINKNCSKAATIVMPEDGNGLIDVVGEVAEVGSVAGDSGV